MRKCPRACKLRLEAVLSVSPSRNLTLARRIRRRRRLSHGNPQQPAGDVRPSTSLPEAKQAPATRVVIAAPGPLRTVLTSRIAGSDRVKLAGVAQDEMGTIEKAIKDDADVVAISIHLGEQLGGLEIARNVSRACPNTGILIIVNSLEGIDLRRHSRLFGTAWSYALAANVEHGEGFASVVQSVARGLHWIDPAIKRELEVAWKTAEEARDLDVESTDDRINPGRRKAGESAFTSDQGGRGIQTAQIGNGGIGTGFGVRKAG